MKQFSEVLRYEYDLSADSLVFDIGGYHGDWAAEIARRYGCRIFCFEPIAEHCRIIRERNIPRLTLFPFAVGYKPRLLDIGISNDSTGAFSNSETRETALLVDANGIVPASGVDLMKINIEGLEYELLTGLRNVRAVRNIQVQFHQNVKDCEKERSAIKCKLHETHEVEYDEPFVWESWRLRQ